MSTIILDNVDEEKRQILNQIIENRQNPVHWIKNNIMIRDQAKGSVKFNMYDFQEKIINLFLSNHFIVTLKSRQVGMSTLVQAFCIWAAIHYANYNIQIISAGNRQATNFLAKMREMYDLIPKEQFKPDLSVDNKQTMTFTNGSKIVALPATRKASLGESINMLIIDEAAFIEHANDVYQSSYPTLSRAFRSMKGKPFGIFIISTPNGTTGTGEWYYKMYTGAVTHLNKYIPVRIHWSEVAEYDQAWYYDQCQQMNWDYRTIMSELELSFVSSGDTFLPGRLLDRIDIDAPLYRDINENLWIFQHPIKDHNYVVGVDVGFGDRQDSSTIQVLDAFTLNQVAEYENNAIRVKDFTDVVIKICKYYNNALCNIERNSIGKVLIQNILDHPEGLGIRLYRDKQVKADDYGKIHKIQQNEIGTLVTGQSRDVILSVMRTIVLDKYSDALEDDADISNISSLAEAKKKFELISNKRVITEKIRGIIKSERLVLQLQNFINGKNGRPEGNHDDLVFAFTHALYCYSNSKQELLTNVVQILSNPMIEEDKVEKKRRGIEFMKRNSDSKLWKNMSVEELQRILDENEEEQEKIKQNNKINNEEEKKSMTESIYDAFFKCY